MAQADGRIVIETSLETGNLAQGAKRIDAACKSAARSAGIIGEKAQIAAAKAVAAYNRQNAAVEQQSRKVDTLREKLAQMEKNPVKAEEYKAVSDEVARLEAELGKASEKKQAFLDNGGTTGSRQFAAMEQQLERIRADLVAARNDKKRMEDYGNAYVPQDTAPVAEMLTAEQGKLDRMNEQLQIAGMSLARVANATSAASVETGRYGTQLDKAAKSQKDVPGKDTGEKMNDFGGALKNGVKSLLKYGLGIRSLYMLFRKLRAALTDGIKNLVQYSSTTNKSMSSIKSSLTQVKNSLATAFQPVLTAVEPILTKLCSMLSQAITYIGMFFTALSGGTKFTKAISVQEDYAKSLQGTGAAAKEAQQQLSGLDEINTWQENSGGGGVGVSPSDMFEDVAIDSKITDIIEKMKSAFTPIVTFIKDNFINPTKQWFAQLNFDALVSSSKGLISTVQPALETIGNLLAWIYQDLLLPLIGWLATEVAPVIGIVVTELINIATAVLSPLIDGVKKLWDALRPVVQWVKDVVILVITKIGEFFSKLASVFEEKGDKIIKIFDGIGKIVSVVWEVVRPIFILLMEVVGAVFDFIGDIVSSVIGSVIDVLAGLIDFIAGVFTGDWDRAWNGIKSIFDGIWNSIKGIVLGIWNFIKSVFTSILDSFVGSIKSLITAIAGFFGDAKDKVLNVFRSMKEKIVSILTTLGNAVKKPVNAIIGAINKMISGVCSGINAVIRALNKLHFNIPGWVPLLGGKSFGFNIREVSAPQIPLLATGAVIPPNAPFAAILGDQRHGTNIETPEALLRQVVREESGGAVYQFVAQLNRRTIFQEMIDEAKLRQASSGVNPFLLGRA
nr:MAG TPA: minor tail protein [Caudoviricetes sp.]